MNHVNLIGRMKLTNPLIIKGGRIPTAKIAFGTANAVGATGNMDGGGDGCDANDESIGMYADAPDTSVSFEWNLLVFHQSFYVTIDTFFKGV